MNTYEIKINGKTYAVEIESVDSDFSAKVKVNGKELNLKLNNPETGNGPSIPVLERKPVSQATGQADHTAAAGAMSASAPAPTSAAGGSVITSPLPGVIIGLHVSVGDQVKAGQRLATLEAMKMENAIEAERAGTVRKIYVSKGDSILEGAKIIAID